MQKLQSVFFNWLRQKDLIFAFNFPFRNMCSIWSPAKRILGRESVHMIQNWTASPLWLVSPLKMVENIYFHFSELGVEHAVFCSKKRHLVFLPILILMTNQSKSLFSKTYCSNCCPKKAIGSWSLFLHSMKRHRIFPWNGNFFFWLNENSIKLNGETMALLVMCFIENVQTLISE